MVIGTPYLIEDASIPPHKLSSVLRVNGLLLCLSAHRSAALVQGSTEVGRHSRIHKTHYRVIQLLKHVSQQHTIYQLLPFLGYFQLPCSTAKRNPQRSLPPQES